MTKWLTLVLIFVALAALVEPSAEGQQQQTITVCKRTIPSGGTGFSFDWINGGGPKTPFTLDDAQCKTFDMTNLNKFNTFTENVPPGWILTSIACTKTTSAVTIIGSNPHPEFQSGDNIVRIDLNEPNVTCTFTNQKDEGAAAMLQYAAKFVCGVVPPLSPPSNNPVAAPGRYFTAINVHNPARSAATIVYKKFAVGLPLENVGEVTKYFEMSLGGDLTMQIDCLDISRHLGKSPPTFLEGYAVIESARELDVVSVYTAGGATGFPVESIHTERVQPRRMPACGAFNTSINTGTTTAWTLVVAPAWSGPVPRAPNVMVPVPWELPGSHYVSGTPTGKTDPNPAGSVWEYETCFCLCPGFRGAKLNLTGARVDDDAQVLLNGSLLGTFSTQSPPASAITSINNNAPGAFVAGRNCLRIKVIDSIGGFTSLDLAGTITGAAASCQ